MPIVGIAALISCPRRHHNITLSTYWECARCDATLVVRKLPFRQPGAAALPTWLMHVKVSNPNPLPLRLNRRQVQRGWAAQHHPCSGVPTRDVPRHRQNSVPERKHSCTSAPRHSHDSPTRAPATLDALALLPILSIVLAWQAIATLKNDDGESNRVHRLAPPRLSDRCAICCSVADPETRVGLP